MKKVIFVLLILAVFVSFTACSNSKDSPENQVIFYNLESDPQTLDPQIAEDAPAQLVITNIFEGLTRIDENNQVIPGAALRWESNQDHTSFTFYLRKDASWSNQDKTPVTAHDFLYGIQRTLSPETDSKTAKTLFSIKNAKKVNSGELPVSSLGVLAQDNYTLKIELEYSYEDFPRLLSTAPAMPCNQAFFESTNGQYGLDSTMILCNGPFRVQTKYGWNHGENLYLLRNDNYIGQIKPIPAGVTFSIGKDTSDLIKAVKSGEVDAGPLLGAQVSQAKELGYHLTSFEDTTWGLCFNFSDEVFQNLNVRKSFIESLSRDYILKDIPENCTEANGIVMDTAVVNGKPYRDQVGQNIYLEGSDNSRQTLLSGLRELDLDSLPTVTVICPDDVKVKSMVSSMLELWNEKLGYYFNMQPISEGKLSDRVQVGDFQIALTPVFSQTDDPLEVLSLFRSNAEGNPCDMKSGEYDRLLTNAELAPIEEKADNCSAAETYLSEQAAFYPLYYQSRYFASGSKVTGVLFYQSTGGVSFINASKTKK